METSATTIVVPPTAEEQRIASIADSINLADPSLTVTYGTEAMQGISRFADDLLSRVQAKDSGELGESLTNLMLKVKDVNVSEVMGSPGFLQSLPLVGSLFSSAKRTVAKFNTLSEQIEIIVDKLDEAMIGLLRDIETLEMLYEHNARFHAELTAYIEAGKRKLEEARTVELPRLKAQADASGDLMEAQQVRDLSEQINRFERRLHDLQLSRTITVQTAPQIRIIQSNNRTLAEKIQTSILATIPIWKSQMVLALSLHGQKNAAALQKTVSDTTNDMLRSNAELLEQAAVDTAREVERSVVDIETLREVHEKLIGTIEETLRIEQEGRERRAGNGTLRFLGVRILSSPTRSGSCVRRLKKSWPSWKRNSRTGLPRWPHAKAGKKSPPHPERKRGRAPPDRAAPAPGCNPCTKAKRNIRWSDRTPRNRRVRFGMRYVGSSSVSSFISARSSLGRFCLPMFRKYIRARPLLASTLALSASSRAAHPGNRRGSSPPCPARGWPSC